MDDNIWVRDGLEPMNKSKLADVLDGRVEPEVYEEEMSRTNGAENGVGEKSSQASVEANQRLREVMLLRAVAEKYGKVLSSAGTNADSMINEFLGPEPDASSGNVKGPVDVDMIEENEVSNANNKNSSSNSLANSFFSSNKKVKEANVDLIERSKHVPLRLTFEQRKVLRLCEAALDVSEYTDKVDVLSWKSKTGRIHEQIRDICAVLSGLAIAADYEVGQKMIKDRSFEDNAEYFATVFEIGRRHKILNPERMRTDYGKLIHLLMDSQSPEVQRLLEFRLVKRISTVHDFLERRNCLRLLEHQDAVIATTAIIDNKLTGKSKADIQREIKAKDKAVKRLVQQFSNQGYGRSESDGLSDDEIEWCLYSMGDNSSFLVFNRDPVDKMILLLKRYFGSDSSRKQQEKELGLDSDDDSEREESSKTTSKTFPRRSLAIQSGHKGARLTHDHNRQYQFALQTMTLWREVQNDMFKLWCLAEDDLLDPDNYYSLRDTGQGLNRIQSAPRIGRAMSEILRRAQRSLGSWIGSSVVHLGDHNVPNALTFIDKYTQVPRILNPIVNVIEAIPQLVSENKGGLGDLIKKNYGSAEECQITILQDFFKHAFDGSGADNFYDAGSCIDGRLTSAWNWCNKLDKKDYYPIFKLAGFTGFDGNFKG